MTEKDQLNLTGFQSMVPHFGGQDRRPDHCRLKPKSAVSTGRGLPDRGQLGKNKLRMFSLGVLAEWN
jgi:hypothetical protein